MLSCNCSASLLIKRRVVHTGHLERIATESPFPYLSIKNDAKLSSYSDSRTYTKLPQYLCTSYTKTLFSAEISQMHTCLGLFDIVDNHHPIQYKW